MNLVAIKQFIELLEQAGVKNAAEFVAKYCLPEAKTNNISLYRAALNQCHGCCRTSLDPKIKLALKNKALKNFDIHQPL